MTWHGWVNPEQCPLLRRWFTLGSPRSRLWNKNSSATSLFKRWFQETWIQGKKWDENRQEANTGFTEGYCHGLLGPISPGEVQETVNNIPPYYSYPLLKGEGTGVFIPSILSITCGGLFLRALSLCTLICSVNELSVHQQWEEALCRDFQVFPASILLCLQVSAKVMWVGSW